MKTITKKILIACAITAAIIYACDIRKETIMNGRVGGAPTTKSPQVAPTAVSPEDRQWKLCWKKPPHAKSISGAREACNPAKVVRLDAAYFTVVATYEHRWQKHQAVLNWEKAKDQYGYWSQPAPRAKGTWRMTRVSADLYNGWYRDSKDGEEGALWLEAIGK